MICNDREVFCIILWWEIRRGKLLGWHWTEDNGGSNTENFISMVIQHFVILSVFLSLLENSSLRKQSMCTVIIMKYKLLI